MIFLFVVSIFKVVRNLSYSRSLLLNYRSSTAFWLFLPSWPLIDSLFGLNDLGVKTLHNGLDIPFCLNCSLELKLSKFNSIVWRNWFWCCPCIDFGDVSSNIFSYILTSLQTELLRSKSFCFLVSLSMIAFLYPKSVSI